MSDRPYAFRFWEAPDRGTPPYIDLCLETQAAVLDTAFKPVLLTWETCVDWVPERDLLWANSAPRTQGRTKDQSARRWALFTDLLRVELIARHGGIWIDADTLLCRGFAALAPVVADHDLVAALGPGQRLMNGIFGARTGSSIARTAAAQMRQKFADKQAEGDASAIWGEYGGALLTRVSAQSDPQCQYIAPFGLMIQNNADVYFDPFNPDLDVAQFVTSQTLAVSLYNNSIATELRQISRADLLAAHTPFAALHRAAIQPVPHTANPLTLNQAEVMQPLFARATAQSDKLQAMKNSRDTLKTKLHQTQDRYRQLKRDKATLQTNLRNTMGEGRKGTDGRAGVFTEIFDQELWLAGGSHSGCGSSLRQTETLRAALPAFLRRHGITSLLDIPCGDFHWMQHIDLTGISYQGADIVEAIVQANQVYASESRRFDVYDLVSDRLPRMDCVMVRDCLSHLTLADGQKALANVRASGAEWLLITHFGDETENKDITTGAFHRLNFCLAPFHLPPPVEMLIENHPNPKHKDKSLALWRAADLPQRS